MRALMMQRTGSALALLSAFALLQGCGPDYEGVANIDTRQDGVVCLGDSLTHGWGVSTDESYPVVLERILGVEVENAGMSGDTTGDALRRLSSVLNRQPRLVIVMLGGNDYLNRVPREDVMENMTAITRRCIASGAMVILVHAQFGLLIDPYYDGFSRIAREEGALLVEDALDDILANPGKMTDQVHPNAAGYALLAERIAAAAEPLLAVNAAARRAE